MSWFRLVFFATVAAALAAWLARSPEGGTCLECVLVTQEAGMEERGEHTLKVVTLNTWGLWLASKKRWRRMDCLGQYLSKTAADVVVLQEVWVRDDVALLREHAARGPLRHAAHFQGGAIGAGLVVLSRHPILEVGFHPFAARGDPVRVLNGDFFAGKGVGWVALATPAGVVDVFNTHLSANYEQRWRGDAKLGCRVPLDGYAGVRLLQILELAAYIKGRASRGAVATVLAGDLNSAPDTLEIAVLKTLLPQLRDAWAVTRGSEPGATANAPGNSFATKGAGHKPIRIDYIWTSALPVATEATLNQTGCGFSYSDHIGVSATLDLGHGQGGAPAAAATAAVAAGGASSGRAGRGLPGDSAATADVELTSAAMGPSQQGQGVAQEGAQSDACSERSDPASPPSHPSPGGASQRSDSSSGADSSCGGGGSGRQQERQEQPTPAECVTMSHAEPAKRERPLLSAAHEAIGQAARDMECGKAAMMLAAVLLWLLGFGALAFLLCCPWLRRVPPEAYTVLLCVMGVAFGWAGTLFVGGFVGRGVEAGALRQQAAQLGVLLQGPGGLVTS